MKYLITFLTAIAALTATAQMPTDNRWTLEQCILYAVEHSPATTVRTARNSIVGQNYREAIGRLLPTLNAGTSAEFSFGRGLGEDNVYADLNSFSNSYRAQTGLTIFSGMRGINTVRLERINRLAGRRLLDQVRDEAAFATMQAFFNVLYYKKMVTLAESQLDESRLNLRQTERMEELGLKGFPDVAEMRAKEASDSYRLTEQQNLLTIGIILLKEQMNFPIESELDIEPYDLDIEPAKTPETAAELYFRAIDYLPRALAANLAAEASKVELQIARGARYPTITMNAGYSTGFFRTTDGNGFDSFSSQFANKRNYYVGASLNIPIFNGFAADANVKRSRHALTIAQTERDAALRALYTEIEQAVADMNGTADRYAQAVRQREYTAVAHDVNRRKYDEGLVSALELHTSSNRLIEARAQELNSRLIWICKKRLVDYYSGRPLY